MSSEFKPERRERFLQSISAALFIEDADGRLLLLKQNENKGGGWGPPAGGVEYGESPEEAAIREAGEEISSPILIKNLIGIYPVKRGNGYPSGIGFVYRGEIVEPEKIKTDGVEVVDARFFNKREVEELLKAGKIYKPEFNNPGIADWEAGIEYPKDIVKSIINAEELYK